MKVGLMATERHGTFSFRSFDDLISLLNGRDGLLSSCAQLHSRRSVLQPELVPAMLHQKSFQELNASLLLANSFPLFDDVMLFFLDDHGLLLDFILQFRDYLILCTNKVALLLELSTHDFNPQVHPPDGSTQIGNLCSQSPDLFVSSRDFVG